MLSVITIYLGGKTDLKNYFCFMTYTLAELNFLYTLLPASTFGSKIKFQLPTGSHELAPL